MTKYRRNAVVIDFNVMPVRPDIESVSKFISKGLKLNLARVENLQFNNSRNHVIIELGSPEEASEPADNHNLKHKVGCRGKGYAIPVFVEDDAVQIRVHDLPPHMPNDVIIAHLEAYGEVKSIRNEVWREHFPGIPNGVRAVRMVLKKPIPSFITVEEDLGYINYINQQKTCRHCSKPLHHGTTNTTSLTPTASTKPSPTNATITKTISTITTTTNTTNDNNPPKQPAEDVPQKNISKQMDISSEEDESNKTNEENETASATTTASDHEEHSVQTKRTRPKRTHQQKDYHYDPWFRRFR